MAKCALNSLGRTAASESSSIFSVLLPDCDLSSVNIAVTFLSSAAAITIVQLRVVVAEHVQVGGQRDALPQVLEDSVHVVDSNVEEAEVRARVRGEHALPGERSEI